MSKNNWNFANLPELHKAANSTLRFAMLNERSKRWSKVADSYRKLLWMIDRQHFPAHYEPPDSYFMLQYELLYHLGVAQQHLGEHRKAVSQFTKAINFISRPKGGCLAGCVTNSCLMTPIYCRRAFAYCRTGDLGNAIRDAERAVVLDNMNPDVFCIRALVRGSRDEKSLALQDLDKAMKHSPSHMCAIMIRDAMNRPLSSSPRWKDTFNLRLTAVQMTMDADSFNAIIDFNHSKIMQFFDRFLFTLSVPHTITVISLTPDKPSKKQIEQNTDVYKTSSSNIPQRHHVAPFRCGTPSRNINRTTTRRRIDYGEALRKFVTRPKTASDFLAVIAKQRKVTFQCDNRAASARTERNLRSNSDFRTCAVQDSLKNRPKTNTPNTTTNSNESGRKTKTFATKTFIIEGPKNYNISVFQQTNIRDAPRMYYKPWLGDKLPVAVVNHPQTMPAFY